jgi:hypothetical protein
VGVGMEWAWMGVGVGVGKGEGEDKGGTNGQFYRANGILSFCRIYIQCQY